MLEQVKINTQSSVPIYAQIAEQLERLMLSGQLKKDSRLPSVRELALHLRINPNTVVKAYQTLQEREFVVSVPGSGFRVSAPLAAQTKRRSEELLGESIASLISLADSLGFTPDQIRTKVEKQLNLLMKERAP